LVCGVSRPTVRRWRAEGLPSPVELPFGLRRVLYRSDVEAFVRHLPAAGEDAP
jgi:predicted site-specific integrase-resolvase